jgi:hypothetical protein
MEDPWGRCLSVAVIIICWIGCAGRPHCLAQTSGNHGPRAAAAGFYRVWLPDRSVFEADLTAIQPYVSPRLYSLLRFEFQRRDKWGQENPDLKPPLSGDFFLCYNGERPSGFHVGTTRAARFGAIVEVRLDWVEENKVWHRCKVKAYLIRMNGRWLLDNVFYYHDVDLKTLLSRKEYTVIPEWHPRSARKASHR